MYDQPSMKRRNAVVFIVLAYALGVASPYLSYWAFGAFLRHAGFGHTKEVSRQTSPDNVLDAVVMQNNPGAFSSFQYFLYVVPEGTKNVEASGEYSIMDTSEGDELKVRWERAHFLVVDIGNSHVKSFANLWYSDKVKDYYVELVLSSASGKHYLQDDGKLRGE